MGTKNRLFIVDPENDFVDKKGALYVNGADESSKNLVKFIDEGGEKIDDVDESLDSHHLMHIAHPLGWINSKGEHPPIFTIIHIEDVEKGKWFTTIPYLRKWGLEYVKSLKTNGRYELCIWHPHCLIGSWGAGVYPPIYDAITRWEQKYKAVANKTAKGSNIKTEHYSVLKADVTDPEDTSTLLNTKLVERLEDCERLFIAGWAGSHCTKFTAEDIVDNFGVDSIKKIYLLTDCIDSVKGFEDEQEKFFENIERKGAHLITTKEVLNHGF